MVRKNVIHCDKTCCPNDSSCLGTPPNAICCSAKQLCTNLLPQKNKLVVPKVNFVIKVRVLIALKEKPFAKIHKV